MNIYKRLFVVAALCSMFATTIMQAVVSTVTPGYLTIGLINQQNNYVNFTNDDSKAEGFDIQMYCFIARHVGLRPKFVNYTNSSSTTDYSLAIAALADGNIDCFGGGNTNLGNVSNDNAANPFWGVVTNTEDYGIAFLDQDDTDAADLNCDLMKLVELAVNLAVSNGAYACYVANNNNNVAASVTSLLLVDDTDTPSPFYSTVHGYIPAPIFGSTFGCSNCPTSLPRTSCLVDYLLLNNKGCDVTVNAAPVVA
jgi:hypothetical protein